MAYQHICQTALEADGSCLSPVWLPVSDLALMDMTDANALVVFAITGILIAVTFRLAIHQLFNRN